MKQKEIEKIEKKVQIQAEGGRDTDSWSWFLADVGKAVVELFVLFFVFALIYSLSLIIPVHLSFLSTSTLFIVFGLLLILLNMFSPKTRFFLFSRIYRDWDAIFFPQKLPLFCFSYFGLENKEKEIFELAKIEGRRFYESLGVYWRMKKWAEYAKHFREQGLKFALKYHFQKVFLREHFLKLIFACIMCIISFFVFVEIAKFEIERDVQNMKIMLKKTEFEEKLQNLLTDEEKQALMQADVFNKAFLNQQLREKYSKQIFAEKRAEKIKELLNRKKPFILFYSFLVFVFSFLFLERKYIIAVVVYLKQKRSIWDRINAYFSDIETDTEISTLKSLAISYLKKIKYSNLEEKIYLGQSTGMLERVSTEPARCYAAQTDVYCYEDDLHTNLITIGGIGTGKTTGIIQPALLQLSKKDNRSFIVFDPKRELFDFVSSIMDNGVIIGERGKGVNLLSLFNSEELESYLTEFSEDMQSSEKFWYYQGAKLIRVCMEFLQMVAKRKNEDISLLTFMKIQSFIRKLRNEEFLQKFDEYKETKEYQNLQSFLFMPNETFGSILANAELFLTIADIPYLNKEKETLSPYTHLEQDIIFYIDLPVQGGIATKIARFLLFKLIFKNTLARLANPELNQDRKVFFVVDEMQEVVSSRALSDLALSRAAKLSMIAATQSISQLYSSLGKEKADTVLNNFRNKIYLATDDPVTIEKIQKVIDVYDVSRSVQISESWTTTRQVGAGAGLARIGQAMVGGSVGAMVGAVVFGGIGGGGLSFSKAFSKSQSVSVQPKSIPSSYLMSNFSDFVALVIINFGNTTRYDFVELKPIFLYPEYKKERR